MARVKKIARKVSHMLAVQKAEAPVKGIEKEKKSKKTKVKRVAATPKEQCEALIISFTKHVKSNLYEDLKELVRAVNALDPDFWIDDDMTRIMDSLNPRDVMNSVQFIAKTVDDENVVESALMYAIQNRRELCKSDLQMLARVLYAVNPWDRETPYGVVHDIIQRERLETMSSSLREGYEVAELANLLGYTP
jgi:hypothetical protein